MTEAEILSIRNELTDMVISVFSVSFGMISAYIAGLWLVLRYAPLTLRVIAFFVLSCGLAFMGAMTSGIGGLLAGTDTAWTKISTPATGIMSFGSERPDWLGGLSLFEATAALGAFAMITIYVALFYVTFFYSWPGEQGRDA